MRLGGPVIHTAGDPDSWIAGLRAKRYGGAVFPLRHDADPSLAWDYATAARNAGIVIGEVGAWSNPISLDDATCLRELAALDPDTTFIMEHLETQEEYDLAASHIRGIAAKEGLDFIGPA
jgi:hypothetical protein